MRDRGKKICHKAIYKYIGSYAPKMPATLKEMQPLFEQAYHGCRAGLYDKVFSEIYDRKVHHGDEFYIIHKLGAWISNLNLVLNFFPKADLSKTPRVTKRDGQGRLLNDAGLSLLCTGNPLLSENLLKKATKIYRSTDQWKETAGAYMNLADLQFRIGKIIKAKDSAKNSLNISEAAKDTYYKADAKSYLAYTLFLLGKMKDAEKLFEQGNKLYISGTFYADFLTKLGRIDKAFKVSTDNLKHCIKCRRPNAIVWCHRSLGMLERIRKKYDSSQEHLNNTIEISRKIGIFDAEIEALIEMGKLKVDMGDFDDAVSDITRMLKLINYTGFKLYEPAAEVVLAKVYLALGDKDKAKECAQSAYEKAKGMSYYWPQKDAEEVLKSIGNMN